MDEDFDISADISKRYLQLISLFEACYEDNGKYGGNKEKEVPRKRKHLVKDVFKPLGNYNFRRAYRMSKGSFYKLHSILKPLHTSFFFPKGGGNRKPSKKSYIIDTDMRLGMALRYFAGCSPLDIIEPSGLFHISFTPLYGVE